MIKLKRNAKRIALYYALLTTVMFLAFFAASYFGIVNMTTSQLPPFTWVLLFFWYMAFLWVGDRIIKRFILIK